MSLLPQTMSQTLMFFYSLHAALIKCAQKCSNGVHIPLRGNSSLYSIFFYWKILLLTISCLLYRYAHVNIYMCVYIKKIFGYSQRKLELLPYHLFPAVTTISTWAAAQSCFSTQDPSKWSCHVPLWPTYHQHRFVTDIKSVLMPISKACHQTSSITHTSSTSVCWKRVPLI